MLWSLARLIRRHRERLVSLVALPAFILATLPQAACVCEGPGGKQVATEPPASAGVICQCECCSRTSGKQQVCCRAKTEAVEDDGQAPLGLTQLPGKCSQKLTVVPAPSKGHESDHSQLRLTLAPQHLPPLTASQTGPANHSGHERGLHDPPPDVVILLARLTI